MLTAMYSYMDRISASYNTESGIEMEGCKCNHIIDSEFIGNGDDGIYLKRHDPSTQSSTENVFDNVTSSYNENGFVIHRHGITYNVLNNSRLEGNSNAGILFDPFPYVIFDNVFYNNILNNSGTNGNVHSTSWWPDNVYDNLGFGPNIIGGPLIGGNCYTNSAGTGFSDTCVDGDSDGFCDDEYDLEDGDTNCAGSDNCDHYPLKL